MPHLRERDYTYFTTVRGMCRQCRAVVPARVFFRDGGVWQESLCPTCDNAPALIASDREWYLEHALEPTPDRSPLKGSHPPAAGCPHDCGPCAWHASPCQLPVVSITNACNLNCPICFTYNRQSPRYFMPVEEMRRTVDWIVESSGAVDLINLTGGEPTLHPDIFEILRACQRPEIGRVTLNSNGLILAEDQKLCRRLAELDVSVVLSFHAFAAETSVKIHGRDLTAIKLRAIDNLTDAGVKITLLNVMIRGVNEDAAGGALRLMRQNDNILSLTVQTMAYTGQGGGGFPRTRHLPVDDAARLVCEHADGAFQFADFVCRPSAHPLCYLTCYALKASERFLPFARVAPREQIEALMRDSYLLRLNESEEFFREAIDTLYAKGETAHLAVLRELVQRLYPHDRTLSAFERQRAAESAVRTVCIHSHMDEDNFDCARALTCPDLVPAAPGGLIAACTYNLFYRMQDERFFEGSA